MNVNACNDPTVNRCYSSIKLSVLVASYKRLVSDKVVTLPQVCIYSCTDTSFKLSNLKKLYIRRIYAS